MGKSYKKQPYCGHNDRFMKRKANTTVRKINNIPNGNSYKKFFCSYEISDYGWYCTYEEYIVRRTDWSKVGYYEDEEEIIRDWYKSYKAK